MRDELTERGLVIARKAAAKYKARCWWTDLDDLVQEATWAVLDARRRFDPEKGRWDAYAWTAALRWLRGVVWKASAPVSASFHKLAELEGLVRADVAALQSKESMDPDPDQELSHNQWRSEVRGELRRLLDDFAGPLRGAVLAVMLEEKLHQEAAESFGVPRRELRGAVLTAKSRVHESPSMRRQLRIVA